jgi:glutathione S-transferase
MRRPGAVEFLQKRLSALSRSLGDKPYLDGDRFTAGDLMMTTVLRILKHTDIVTSDPRLAAYIERCTARPAFQRALAAQMGDFEDAAGARRSAAG